MPPPLSNEAVKQIEEILITSTSSSLGATYTFEVEKEILARDAERRWNESCSSHNDKDGGGEQLAKGPIDAPADHHNDEGEVDENGCPTMFPSSCGDFLRWGDRKSWWWQTGLNGCWKQAKEEN